MQFYSPKSSIAEERVYRVSMLGTGNGTVPTKKFGQGITLSWVATGRIKLTFSDDPGMFVKFGGVGFHDATPGNVKGYTATAGTYNATALTLEVDIWNASFAAADLATTNFLDFDLIFAASSVAS